MRGGGRADYIFFFRNCIILKFLFGRPVILVFVFLNGNPSYVLVVFWGHLPPWGICYGPPVEKRRATSCHIVHLTKIFIKKVQSQEYLATLLKSLGQKFKSQELWLKNWYLEIFEFWANSRKTFISADQKNLKIFLLQSDL